MVGTDHRKTDSESAPKNLPCREIIRTERIKYHEERMKDPDPSASKSPSPYESPGVYPWYEPEKRPAIPSSDLKLIAFYLPQYHPFEENDRFWGKGFTEWHNVSRALPVFQGHYQPKLPGELGFYDLRLKPVMERQIELARDHGVHGFCFHHYFLNRRPVMRKPFDLFLGHRDLNIPFCIHWANEPWTVRWDGNRNREGVLLDQVHDDEENMAFIRDIAPALRDPRYIRIGNRPVLIIYRPALFPDFRKTAEEWRRFCIAEGLGEPFLVMTRTLFDKEKVPDDYGFDAAVEFPPHLTIRIDVKDKVVLHNPAFKGSVYDYPAVARESLQAIRPAYTLFRGIMPQWDNTPRNIHATVYHGSSPALYQEWLTGLGLETVRNLPADRQFIFINAWNEWAEGACLEPDRRYGYAWLNATAGALCNLNTR